MSTALANVEPTPITSVISADEWNDRRIQFIRENYGNKAPGPEFDAFIQICKRRGLAPEEKQIYLIPRSGKWVPQTSIDGYRLIAERSGLYAGSDDPVYETASDKLANGKQYPTKATVTVWKIVGGVRCPFSSSAHWQEYDTGQNLWLTHPFTMLAKCFDESTQVLTEKGFQKFSEVTARVLQVTDSGLEVTDAKPFAQTWTGNMITLDSDDLNFSVTPNHDMVTTEGKIEAGSLFAKSRARPKHWIPRCVAGTKPDAAVSDQEIKLAAAYLADGSDRAHHRFRIAVSRQEKVGALREIGGYDSEAEAAVAGAEARTSVRVITTRSNQIVFDYEFSAISSLCERDKRIRVDALISLSRRQARLFVDSLIEFDGSINKRTGVRRFYTSRPMHLEAFELASVVAGYAVNVARERTSDISTKPNYCATISARSEIPVIRWGREYHNLSTGNDRKRTGIGITNNESGRVWCVTVPSGVIVVRRNGFSMLCGNCAESQALRKAFPADLSGIYTVEEMEQADNAPRASATARSAPPRSVGPGEQTGEVLDWTVMWRQLRSRKIDAATFESIVGKAAKSFPSPQSALDALRAAELASEGGVDAEPPPEPDVIDVDGEQVDESTGEIVEPPDQYATPRQLKYIEVVAREYGMSEDQVMAEVEQLYGTPIASMSRRDASAYIDRLSSRRDVQEPQATEKPTKNPPVFGDTKAAGADRYTS